MEMRATLVTEVTVTACVSVRATERVSMMRAATHRTAGTTGHPAAASLVVTGHRTTANAVTADAVTLHEMKDAVEPTVSPLDGVLPRGDHDKAQHGGVAHRDREVAEEVDNRTAASNWLRL